MLTPFYRQPPPWITPPPPPFLQENLEPLLLLWFSKNLNPPINKGGSHYIEPPSHNGEHLFSVPNMHPQICGTYFFRPVTYLPPSNAIDGPLLPRCRVLDSEMLSFHLRLQSQPDQELKTNSHIRLALWNTYHFINIDWTHTYLYHPSLLRPAIWQK